MKTIWVNSLGSSRNIVKHLMSQGIVPCMGEGAVPAEVHLDLATDGSFRISFDGEKPNEPSSGRKKG